MWLHHLDFNEMLRKKARWELSKDVAVCFEQILGVASNKTAAVRPLTSHFTNHPSKLNRHIGPCSRSVQWTHKWHFPVEPNTPVLSDQQTLIFICSVWTLSAVKKTYVEQWLLLKIQSQWHLVAVSFLPLWSSDQEFVNL